MATAQSVIDSARYDLLDQSDGVGLGIEYDDTELLNYLNRMVGLLDSNLASLKSDLTEARADNIDMVDGQDYVELATTLNSGNWLDIRSVWRGDRLLEKISVQEMRYKNMHNDVDEDPFYWALSGTKILFPIGVNGPTELIGTATDRTLTGGVTNWANVDINTYDENNDLSITANAIGQYCTLPVVNCPMTANTKYRLKFDVANLTETWYIQDFTGAQTYGTVSAEGLQQGIAFTQDVSGGIRITSVAATSSADFDNFHCYTFDDTLTLFYDKKSAALSLTSSMPYNGQFDEFLREMLVMCAKAKKLSFLDQADGAFNNMFNRRVMQTEIKRGFIPKYYNYKGF
jgi:hypothetical protein